MGRPVAFESERLRARQWRAEDLDDAMTLYCDPEVTRYIGGHTWANRAEAEVAFAQLLERNARWGPNLGGFALFRREDEAVVGAALVKYLPGTDRSVLTGDLEVGWHLATRYQGQGYATEAGRAAITHGFARCDVDRIFAVTEPPNAASQRVARRLGMTPLGRSQEYYGGLEMQKFRILRSEWTSI